MSYNINNVEFQVDNVEFFKAIYSSKPLRKFGLRLVPKIFDDLKSLNNYRIKHILRETNNCADQLTKFSLFSNFPSYIFDSSSLFHV